MKTGRMRPTAWRRREAAGKTRRDESLAFDVLGLALLVWRSWFHGRLLHAFVSAGCLDGQKRRADFVGYWGGNMSFFSFPL